MRSQPSGKDSRCPARMPTTPNPSFLVVGQRTPVCPELIPPIRQVAKVLRSARLGQPWALHKQKNLSGFRLPITFGS
jgi:hypothetical protein